MIAAEDLLSYSKKLYEQKGDEIVLRNAARNAYYALYHRLLDLNVEEIPSSERNYGSHELLIQQLRKCKTIEYRELGLLLSSLKSIRTKADYRLEQRFSDNDAYSTVRKVEKAFKTLSVSEDLDNDSEVTKETSDEAPVVVTNKKTICKPSLKVIK
ncbi:hypothetical protein KW419_12855 [Vibrio fluvialis]|uniref:hypothetical protein n=1 Tax=Vibrio cholerae TaxID=666 RepID=UPI001C9DC43C|nr:hypothetical protein [Vibrio cholerae]MBY7859134.1 hypothetical protein [Vibrio fluvialis]MCX9527011.1 hypothetical protein [Vibrio cholerae]